MPRKPKNSFNKNAALFSTRIHNMDTLQLINELAEKFGNRNAVLNNILDIGAPILYAQFFGKETKAARAEKSTHNPSVGRELKELRKITDDMFVLFNVQEALLASLTNVKAAELNGEKVNAAQLLNGSMSALPEFVAGIKADLTTRRGGGDE